MKDNTIVASPQILAVAVEGALERTITMFERKDSGRQPAISWYLDSHRAEFKREVLRALGLFPLDG